MKVLITGTSQGIGLACAEKFLKEGHEVIGFDISESAINDPHYTHYHVDIFKSTLPTIADVEVLVNNAGVQNTGDDIDVNLKGTIRITEKYALQKAIKSVVFIASSAGISGAEFPEYVAGKGGMIAYMKNVALRAAKYGATANALAPGGVITALNEHILQTKALYEAVLKETLLNKWASAQEIAEWVYFIAVINRSMTAETILIDNGERAKANFIW